jgi:cytochrome c-type biogenesis protein CcmH/NrfF
MEDIVWWHCEQGNDHEWKASIKNRRNGSGCPICANKKIVESNSLLVKHPKLAEEWHPWRNSTLTPRNIGSGSKKNVWWKCEKGDDHEWQSAVYNRKNGSGCPICSNTKVVISNSLLTLNPELAKEWHPSKNDEITPKDVGIGSQKLIWWQCPKGHDHEWKTSVYARHNGSRCPICLGQKIVESNCLSTTHPEIAIQWHPTKNKKLSPQQFGFGSTKKIWWKCDKGDDHEWKVSINNRSKGHNCSVCSNQKIVLSNSLAVLSPDLAEEWHPINNGSLTPFLIGPGYSKKVWWQCRVNSSHTWLTRPASRNKGTGCPYCTLTPQSKQELIITFELRTLFKRIDPKGYKTSLDGKLRAIDIFIPKLNLCLEFDGSYWHKDKRELDKIKSEMLLKEGYSVIRIREEPLKKIHGTDVISKRPYDGKQVTNDILSMILSMYNLNSEMVERIEDYQFQDGLQNEKGLNRYIDKILKEKADKNLND